MTVSASVAAPSPVSDDINQTEIQNLNLTNAAKALDYLPGVSIQHIATNRNEAGILVRGFSARGQIPLYLDGIPISVPYDGYIDFNRFLTSDLAEVQVAFEPDRRRVGTQAPKGEGTIAGSQTIFIARRTPAYMRLSAISTWLGSA